MNQQIILALIPTLGPIIIGLIGYIYHIIYQRLPAQQRAALSQLILPIVQYVREKYAQHTPAQRYAAAIAFVNDAFILVGLPVPDAAIVAAFVNFVFEQYGLKS